MTTRLVLVHGRGQQAKDADDLKAEWLTALSDGPRGRALPIPESDVFFPYYGDTLAQLTADATADDVAEVIVRGDDAAAAEQVFVRQVVTDMLAGAGVTEDIIRGEAPPEVVERGPLAWEWVHTGLSLIDRFVPGASGAAIARVTRDVAKYLLVPGVRRRIDRGVARAFAACRPRDDVVVVAHSLGTVVAYNLLRSELGGFRVPLFVTLGSPLGVEAIRNALMPLSHPEPVGRWLNAYDTRDVVALYALDRRRFDISPAIDNHGRVRNDSSNHHGIAGYLQDSRVADEILGALG